MNLYLDNCCYNRPFDDQSSIRIRLEAEAKLKIQEDIRHGLHELVWSYVLDYENSRNPFRERHEQIAKRSLRASRMIEETQELLALASRIHQTRCSTFLVKGC